MKMSTKGRYGTRLMLDLALNDTKTPVLLRDISQRLQISEKYLWQLIASLKNAGLIKSTRGAHGGYALAKNPASISLKDIIYTLEGAMCITDCVEDPLICEKSCHCVTRDIWHEMSDKINDILETVTLQDMMEKYKHKSNTLSFAI